MADARAEASAFALRCGAAALAHGGGGASCPTSPALLRRRGNSGDVDGPSPEMTTVLVVVFTKATSTEMDERVRLRAAARNRPIRRFARRDALIAKEQRFV